MANLERGESSSSPNADIYILSAEWGTAESGVKLGLSDGSSFFVLMSRYDSSRYGEGCSLTADDLEYLREGDEEFRIFKKALDLQARREHSVTEMRLKLLSRGFRNDLIRDVCGMLETKGYLDDRRFAEIYAESRLRRKPEGRLRMEQRLRQKGVSPQTASSVLSDLYTHETTDEALAGCCERIRRKKGPLTPDELRRELGSLGFLPGEISSFVESLNF